MIITLLLASIHANLLAQKIIKAELVFKGIQNKENSWQLCFEDRKGKSFCFNTQRSNTEPYVFYSTEADGSLKENEKVKEGWFLVSYTFFKTGNKTEKIITHVEIITGPKIKTG